MPFFPQDMEQGSEESDNESMGYDTCEEKVAGDVTAGLVASAQPVIEFLAAMDVGAAKIVAALCLRLEKRDELVERLRGGVKKARDQRDVAQAKVKAREDAQGQIARHWWKTTKLQEKLDFARRRNQHLARKVWHLTRMQHGLPPYPI